MEEHARLIRLNLKLSHQIVGKPIYQLETIVDIIKNRNGEIKYSPLDRW